METIAHNMTHGKVLRSGTYRTRECGAGIVGHVLDGDVGKVARYQGRFVGVAFPGETYVTSYWKEGYTILPQAKAKEHNAMVISNAAVMVGR